MEALEERPPVAVIVDLTVEELKLVRAGLTMLLHAEDDPATIFELKQLITRLEHPGEAAPRRFGAGSAS